MNKNRNLLECNKEEQQMILQRQKIQHQRWKKVLKQEKKEIRNIIGESD